MIENLHPEYSELEKIATAPITKGDLLTLGVLKVFVLDTITQEDIDNEPIALAYSDKIPGKYDMKFGPEYTEGTRIASSFDANRTFNCHFGQLRGHVSK